MDIIIYGMGGVAHEFKEWIKCYNQLKRVHIRIVGFTDSYVKSTKNQREGNVVSVDDLKYLKSDYIVIASRFLDEICTVLENKNIDMEKVIASTNFYPEGNERNIGQLINAFYLERVQTNDEELKKSIQDYMNGKYFIDVLGRRRFVGNQEAIRELEQDVTIYKDFEWDLKYVIWEGKKIYYPCQWDEKQIREYHLFNVYTCMNTKSSHRYLTDSFTVKEGDVVADIGAAEGLFLLSVIEKVKKAYVFEIDDIWYRPLQATFSKYKKKVVIEHGFVSNIDWEDQITLDKYFSTREINLIKMDIEGAEQKVLLASKTLLKRENLKWVIASYHKPEDAIFLDTFMKQMGYRTETAEQYLWIDQWEFGCQPFGEFRKAMIHAYRESEV